MPNTILSAVYLSALRPDAPVAFAYRMRARFPLRAQTPPSTAYEYHAPGNRVTLAPSTLEVR